MCGIPALPLEIIGLVVDELRCDPDALNACSLVCRAWTPFAQSHIFRTLYYDTDKMPLFSDYLLQILSLFTQSPQLTFYVQHIDIVASLCTDANLARLLKLFPCVKSMRFSTSAAWNLVSESLRDSLAFVTRQATFRDLRIWNVTFRNGQDFVKMVGDAAGNVQSLELVNVVVLKKEGVVPVRLNSLARLRVHESRNSSNVTRAQATPTNVIHAPELKHFDRSFNICPLSTPDFLDLPRPAHSIASLNLDIHLASIWTQPPGPERPWPAIDASMCTNLRRLNIRITEDDHRQGLRGLKWIASFLSNLPRTCALEHIQITIPIDRGVPMDIRVYRELSRIDDILKPYAEDGGLQSVLINLERIRGHPELETPALLSTKFTAETVALMHARRNMPCLRLAQVLRARFVDSVTQGVLR